MARALQPHRPQLRHLEVEPLANHLEPGADAAIAYAVEVLIRIRATLDTVFHDHPKDLSDPARKPFLRQQYKEVSTAIAELQRSRAG